ncbi:hypothetical protein LMG29542_07005 [Paraburkholderia humisilvae]|uniref:Type 3 secretion system stator protein n=2 Tax=Paraburkholderia humisilvae TaxID=627669 RepID=A0A6J5F5F6_9BURK|nr:hypothetical protein LMG29542_07005 [Paraburkholderia humisilvae]
MVIWLKHNRRATMDSSVEVDDANLGLQGDVIPAAVFGELLELEQANAALARERLTLLADARAQAEAIVDDARQAAARLLEQAREEYEDASERGYADGLDHARTEWMEQVASSAETQSQLQRGMRTRLAEIVSSAVEQIVSVQNRDALFERALTTVERIVDGATYLRVTVHPQDVESAQMMFDQLVSRWRAAGSRLSLSVTADKRLPVGSCICESDCGTIDASLTTQLRAMRNAVSRALNRAIDVGGPEQATHGLASTDDTESVTDAPTDPTVTSQHDGVGHYPYPIDDEADE